MKKLKDTLLILTGPSDGILSTVLVRSAALEQNPELLERLRTEAREEYNQTILVEEPRRAKPSELPKWLVESNGDEVKEPDPWYDAAMWALSGALEHIAWHPETSRACVILGEGPQGYEHGSCYSLSELIDRLNTIGQRAWSEKVPVDGGGEAFEYGEHVDVRGDLLERWGEELRRMGWI